MTMTCEIIVTSKTNGCVKAALSGELCIFNAVTMKSALLELLEEADACDIDLASVSEVDTAGVQLLLVMQKEAERKGCILRLTNHSFAVSKLIDLLRLTPVLSDPLAQTAAEGLGT